MFKFVSLILLLVSVCMGGVLVYHDYFTPEPIPDSIEDPPEQTEPSKDTKMLHMVTSFWKKNTSCCLINL